MTDNVPRSPTRYWMKHDVKAFVFETATTDAEGAGALALLRGHYFMTGGLPKTDAECSRVCKLSARKFARHRPWLFSFFDENGRSAYLDALIAEAERISEARRDAGRKGGAGKALAFARQSHKQDPEQSQSQSPSNKEPESLSSLPPAPPPPLPDLPAREADEVAGEALASLPVSCRSHPGWRGLSAWIGRLLADGVDRADIVVGIAQSLLSLKDEPPSTFGYFNRAIERAREVRTRPLPEAARPQSVQHELGDSGEILKNLLGEDVFAAWFGGSKLICVSGDIVTISVATPFYKSRIVANFELACIRAFKASHPAVERLTVIVEDKA